MRGAASLDARRGAAGLRRDGDDQPAQGPADPDLFGDGRDGTRDHTLAPEERILAINLPPPVAGERAAYRRAISRTYAEWPLVEAVVRIVLDGDRIRLARIAVGGIAPVPLRLPAWRRAWPASRLTRRPLRRQPGAPPPVPSRCP